MGLDDIFGKKKEAVPVLDLSKSTANNKEEFKRLLEKVPDYKIRPVKVRVEDIKIKDKEWSFKPPKKETKHLIKNQGEHEKSYTYQDPVPQEMRGIVLMEICNVPIDWRMLTTARPKTKTEEDYFSRLIEMGKLQLRSEAREKREALTNVTIKKVKNRSGIIETRILSCNDCMEEFCNGNYCPDVNYDLYFRKEKEPPKKPEAQISEKEARKLMRAGMVKVAPAGKKGGKKDKAGKKKKSAKSKNDKSAS